FLLGRCIGRPALRFVPLKRVERATQWLSDRGPMVVFLSRFTPGLRTATYFAAGSLRTRFQSFAGYFLLAAFAWTPLVVGLAAVLGSRFHSVRYGAAIPFVGAGTVLQLFRSVRDYETRRRWVGFFKRIGRWEFWPVWAAYLPLAPFWLYLALRYRSLTLF